jgi:hypothetical protein
MARARRDEAERALSDMAASLTPLDEAPATVASAEARQ